MLLAAADSEFLKKGFEASSIDCISHLSGVSKSTIYRHYANKKELFEEALKQIAEEQGALIGEFELDPSHPVEALHKLALHIHAVASMPRYLEYLRLIISESGRLPTITQRAKEYGVNQVLDKLTNFFNELIQNQKMIYPDPERAAVLFYTLSRGSIQPLVDSKRDSKLERQRLAWDIDVFLKGTGIMA